MKSVSCVLRVAASALALAATAGCAWTRVGGLSEARGAVPDTAWISGIPFHPQQKHHCGPASLATVLNWTGDPVTPDDLVAQVYTPGLRGTLQREMLTATRRRGRVAYEISGLDALLREVAAGHPVVVLQNLAFGWYPIWHYAVIIGYDLSRGRITLRSGRVATQERPLDTFMRTWRRAGHWGLVVMPPDRLPASAEPMQYVKAATGLERARQWEAASRSYRTALARWPENVTAWIGLGNSLYALGDLAGAEAALRKAIRIDPESGAALNNLALVLSAQGRRDEALVAARRAIALGGPHAEIYSRTLQEIEEGAPPRSP